MQYKDCYTLTLVLSEVDISAFEPQIRHIRAQGITFATLAEEQKQQPEWLPRFCDLENETRKGIDAPRSVEQMKERLAFLKVVPDALFLAKLKECYLGYTCLNVAESDLDCLIQGWTGVRPEYRRQGIGTALKMLSIIYAKQHGYKKIVTTPRFTNTASVRMSQKVGFRHLAG
jgi:GNAT superfamily N-acetyltransferase